MKTLAPSVMQRDPKGLKFMSVAGAAYDKACLSEEEAQCVNDTPGLADHIAAWLEEHRAPQSKYKGKKVQPAYGYPREYKGPKPIADQIAAIAKIFGLDPALALEYAKKLPALPNGAEGWFAIPSVDALVRKHFPEVTDPAEKYCKALQLVYQKIGESRPFTNWRKNQIDTAHIKVSWRTLEAMQKIATQQKGDVHVIAAQLGKRWGGYCVGLARDSFVEGEYGLTSVAGGSIVLVHPERLVRWEELDMDLSGDEFSDDGDGVFDHAPCLYFSDKAEFYTKHVGGAYDCCGSSSFFAPQ